MNYSILEIAKVLGIKDKSCKEATISILLTDSRKVVFPSESLFFALTTHANDGHKFVRDLYAQEVQNFVVTHIDPDWVDMTDANFLVVKNTLSALQKVASFHRNRFDIPIVGITGSNGKTIVKEWLYQVVSPDMNVTHSPRSYNSQIGVPLSVWQIEESTQIGVFEAGISQCEEMVHLQSVIRPTIGVITNIGQAHQEGFESLRQKTLEKLELFVDCDVIICEEENKLIEECMEAACLSQKRLTWSRRAASDSPVKIYKIEKEEDKTFIRLSALEFSLTLEIPFTDEASIENAMNVFCTAFYLRISPVVIAERMKCLEPVAMRLDIRPGKNNCTLINDTYNSDINSLGIALDFLKQRAASSDLKKVLILSDIPQSGMANDKLYNYALELMKRADVQQLIAIGPEIYKCKEVFKSIDSVFFLSTDQFLNSPLSKELSDSMILLKGARSFLFENIDRILEMKTHETVLEVNLDAVVHNFNFYRSRLNPNTKIVCMVKADAYGSGAVEVAKTLQYHKCDYLAVAVAEEGVVLRKAGITLPIIVLNPEVNSFDDLATYNLEPEVYNFRILDAYIKAARRQGLSNYPIHLKLDTGMHRLGFTEEDIPELTTRLNEQNSLSAQSVFSHLAASESWSFDSFTTQQVDTFKRATSAIEDNLKYPILKHILNSAGIERFPEEQLDMVRLGISLYGISASGLEGLKNVCSLKTTILQIKHIKQGETVGYGRKGRIEKDSTIATIRIGYADGLNRRLGNGAASVIVNGHKVPLVGNVCMDLSMIDITGVNAKEGDTVVIFGDDPTVTALAEQIDTIPYEVLTSVSHRVKRVYFKE